MEQEQLVSGREFTQRRPLEPEVHDHPVPGFESVPESFDDAVVPGASPTGPPPGWEAPATVPVSGGGVHRAEADHPLPTRAPLSRSFLADDVAPTVELGMWRRMLAKLGIRSGPTAEESAEAADIRAISRLWWGPRTIAVVNPKGGASKTPTTMMLAAMFARLGGAGVLAWCNNVTRGSLGWRAEPGAHQATVLDLLQEADELTRPGARMADLARFVRHQSEDRYDVLSSAAHLRPDQQRITEGDFDLIWQVATKYFRLTFIDSGNEETAPNWLRMVDRSDALVVPMANRRDHAEAAREMLQQLRARDAHSAWLAANAVVVISEATPGKSTYVEELVREFSTEGREVVVIPHDAGVGADWVRYGGLQRRTQRAYLRAAAAVAARLDMAGDNSHLLAAAAIAARNHPVTTHNTEETR